MSLINYLKHFVSFNHTESRGIADKILSKELFRRVLERERARADRYGGGFSLTVFDVNESDNPKINEHYLSEIISKRLRPTDEVGWFEKARVGIVLPNTTPWGARKLSEDICQKIANTRKPPVFRIYTYPFEGISRLNKDSQDIFRNENEALNGGGTENQPIIATRWNCEVLAESLEHYWGHRTPTWKRAIDIVGAALGLFLLSPLIVVIAILIKIVSPGPVFFKQNRVGYLGQQFTLYKFRTMSVGADTNVHKDHISKLIKDKKPLAKLDNFDSRIIPFGKFLRLTGLDELPQLINILKGEMSLIGPRPELQSSLQHCERWHTARLETKPGLSGLWQISNRTGRTFDEMMRLDISYVKQISFRMDAMILLKTVPTILAEARR
jgi:lipopolysaccharide/colanic/teichoic acid biosynthesis glycosyltransferase